MRQVFERFSAASPAVAADARFDFFMRAVWPRVKDSVTRGARFPRTHECTCVRAWCAGDALGAWGRRPLCDNALAQTATPPSKTQRPAAFLL